MTYIPICQKCGSDKIDMMVDITIVLPAKYESRITKKVLYSKECEVWGANWERAAYFCKNPDCLDNRLPRDPKWVDHIRELEEENKLLKERLELLGGND